MSNVPQELRYSKDHEWVKIHGDQLVIGITDHAQQALGDLTYVDLPGVGSSVTKGETVIAVESTKAASDVFAPVAGEVVAVNDRLQDAPELINQDPYGEGWICRIKGFDPADIEDLLDAPAYTAFLEEESQ